MRTIPNLLLVSIVLSACGDGAAGPGSEEESASGGSVATGGAAQSAGGRSGSGGSTVDAGRGASGGTAQKGGSTGSGGSSAAGGSTGSGGSSAAGGSTGSGGSSAAGGSTGSGGSGGAHVVGSCALGAVGEWQNITPSVYKYGNAFVIDPKNTAIVYATGGNEGGGRQKSTDCGTTWTRVNTGRNADVLSKDGSWTMVIDPIDTETLYANVNYGAMGLYKTTNGGVDWDQILTPDAAKALQYGGFVENIAMDPTNHLHLTVTPHFACENGHDPNCLIETTDGGVTWKVIEGTPGMNETGGQVMLDATTWYWMGNGLHRTTNAGQSWTRLSIDGAYPYSFYRADSGDFYLGGGSGVAKSTDGGVTFQLLASSPHAVGLAGDGTRLYASWQWGQGYQTATMANPTSWTTMPSPSSMSVGGWMMRYDPDHHLLYSANTPAGFWRVRTE